MSRENRASNVSTYIIGGILAFILIVLVIIIVISQIYIKPNVTTLTFIHPNGTTEIIDFERDEEVYFPEAELNAGYKFVGWFATQDSVEVEIKPEDILLNTYKELTIYAKYTAIQYNVLFDYNGNLEGLGSQPAGIVNPNANFYTVKNLNITLLPLTGLVGEGTPQESRFKAYYTSSDFGADSLIDGTNPLVIDINNLGDVTVYVEFESTTP